MKDMNLKEWCDKNWYYLKDTIDYEWDRYWDGNVSITSILKLIVDPTFEFVMNKYKDQVEEAANEWTRIHKQAEDFHTKWSWVNEINKNFMLFHTLYWIESIWQELTFYKEWVRWTVDAVWSNIEWKLFNIDYKNTNKHSEKYCLQLWWYKWLNGNDGMLVYGKWKLKVIEVPDYYLDLFVELKDLFFTLLNNK